MPATLTDLRKQRDRLIEKVKAGGRGVTEARARLRKVTDQLMELELGTRSKFIRVGVK